MPSIGRFYAVLGANTASINARTSTGLIATLPSRETAEGQRSPMETLLKTVYPLGAPESRWGVEPPLG